jgi:hypothetical protein
MLGAGLKVNKHTCLFVKRTPAIAYAIHLLQWNDITNRTNKSDTSSPSSIFPKRSNLLWDAPGTARVMTQLHTEVIE